MRYGEGDRESEHVEDRRGRGPFPRGVRIPAPRGRGAGIGIGGLILIGVACLLLGINPLAFLGGGLSLPDMPRPQRPGGAHDVPGLPGQPGVGRTNDEMARFVARVLADNEDVWERVFEAAGRQYHKPTLVLFNGTTSTACGPGQAAMGPFYCPLDRKIYIDLSFYDDLKRRFGAPGDFAQAYVIAHEIGHHVQNLLGIAEAVTERKQEARSEAEANALQVRMELQADCLAGVWASLNEQLRSRLEPGDVQEGLNAAAAIGDDTMQRRTQGYIVPDAFTHGTSAERVGWFRRGLESGQVQACDTFNAGKL